MNSIVLLFSLCLVGCLVGDSLKEIPQFVRRGHFEGRSGNVVVLPAEKTKLPTSVLLLDQHRHHGDSIKDVSVANLIAHLFESPPPSNEEDLFAIDRSSFPVLSLFSAPAANVFVAINDVDRSILEKYPTLSFLEKRQQMNIMPTSQTRDTLSALETLISGVPPSQHGIVGRSWMSTSGTEASAFRDSGSGSRVDSLFDVFALTSPSSLIVSMSSDFQLASAIGIRAQSRKSMSNILSYYWNSKHQNFDSLSGPRVEHSIHSSRADILQSFKGNSLFAFDGVTFSFDAKNMQLFVSVRSTKDQSVAFDLNSEEDFRLFVEVFFVKKFLQTLKEESFQSLVQDAVPDSFAFAFDGVSTIRNKYGPASHQFSAALHLVDSTVNSLFAEISEAYNGKISTQVACLSPVPVNELPEDVFQQLDDNLPSVGGLNNFLPDIYMGNELSLNEEKTLVAQMNVVLENAGFAAYWFGRQGLHQDIYLSGHHRSAPDSKRQASYNKPIGEDFGWNVYRWFGFHYNHSGETYTLSEVNNYQVTLWSGVILVLIAYGGCCAMCLLDPEKNNELLYRTTALGRETDTIPGGEYDFKPM